MNRTRLFSAMVTAFSLGAVLLLAGCGSSGSDASSEILAAAKQPTGPSLSTPVSERDIVPMGYGGNFISSDDDQVCYDMSQMGYIGEFTSEMRGFKIDPPINFDDGHVNITLWDAGKSLDWEASDAARIQAFIVKGGPNYNVYNYVGTGLGWDQGLGSPQHGRNTPQISHYNVCYTLEIGEPGDQGCTPGYWRNHADRWLGVASNDDFDTIFGVDLFSPEITLEQAIWMTGGGVNALARHVTAALLNAHGGVPNSDETSVEYPYTAGQVIQMVQDAVADNTIEETKDLFAAANELGCPLSGTSAVAVQ